jgi:hypothetical protein
MLPALHLRSGSRLGAKGAFYLVREISDGKGAEEGVLEWELRCRECGRVVERRLTLAEGKELGPWNEKAYGEPDVDIAWCDADDCVSPVDRTEKKAWRLAKVGKGRPEGGIP